MASIEADMVALVQPPAVLDAWGWDEAWAAALAQRPDLAPARVIAQHRGRWTVVGEGGERPATLTGRFRFSVLDGIDQPAVGDWVGCEASGKSEARIEAVLPRRSAFVRRAAGSSVAAQVVAANVDTLLVASSLNRELNARRLERYLAMGRESGAEPVVVLTKSDLVTDPAPEAARMADLLRVAVFALSAETGDGIEALSPWLVAGRTVALVGSSGVGKSTLLNRLAGMGLQATAAIREDARGRHVTTRRELFRIAGGVLILDTPGMRELGMWDAAAGIEDAFAEIADLALRCRFRDCSHEREPGCAVQAALAVGALDPRRLRSYRRLSRELAEQPSPAERREAQRRFFKAVRNASRDSMARKSYP